MQGKTEIDQLKLIFGVLGSPTEDRWPGWTKLPGGKSVGWRQGTANQLRATFPTNGFRLAAGERTDAAFVGLFPVLLSPVDSPVDCPVVVAVVAGGCCCCLSGARTHARTSLSRPPSSDRQCGVGVIRPSRCTGEGNGPQLLWCGLEMQWLFVFLGRHPYAPDHSICVVCFSLRCINCSNPVFLALTVGNPAPSRPPLSRRRSSCHSIPFSVLAP